jgi:hypothetical protein
MHVCNVNEAMSPIRPTIVNWTRIEPMRAGPETGGPPDFRFEAKNAMMNAMK